MTADILNHLWQSTVFAAVAALLSFAFRRNRARLRYALWFAASVKFLVPFAALTAAGSLVAWTQAPAPVATVMTSPIIRDVSAPFAELSFDTVAAVPAASEAAWVGPSLFALWLCGFAAVSLRRLQGWRQVVAAVRAGTPWQATVPVPSGIRVRSVPTRLEPGIVGLWKPVILLPAGIEGYLTARQLEAVLAHEVCHAQRRDNLTAAVHMLVETVFWFHPMVWWIGARLVVEREQACDEHVLAETAEPVAYAEGIVTICRRYVEAPLMSVAGVGGADVKARIDAILSSRVGLRLTLWKRLALASVAALSLTVPVITGAIEAATFAAGPAQDAKRPAPPVDPEARFEVVSIRRFDMNAGVPPRVFIGLGRFDSAGGLLRIQLPQALGIPPDRLFGLPDWIDSEHYAIAARAPQGTPDTALTTMIRNLLKDRFGLVWHRETRELPVFDLVFARNDKRFGPGFKETSAECLETIARRGSGLEEALDAARKGGPPTFKAGDCGTGRINPGIASFHGGLMVQLASILGQIAGRTVIDKTGLTSRYDYTLTWAPEPGAPIPGPFGAVPAGALPPGSQPPPPNPDAPNIFTAVQDQLGLKLESSRAPLEVVVIDRMEKPTLDQ